MAELSTEIVKIIFKVLSSACKFLKFEFVSKAWHFLGRSRLRRWKKRHRQIYRINFSYLDYSIDDKPNQSSIIREKLTNDGWSIAESNESRFSKKNIYSVDQQIFALEYDVGPNGYIEKPLTLKTENCYVEFVINDQIIKGGIYICIEAQNSNGSRYDYSLNITNWRHNPDIGPHGDGSLEWLVYWPKVIIKPGWQSILVNVRKSINKSKLKGDYHPLNIKRVRLRGSLQLVSVNFFSENL